MKLPLLFEGLDPDVVEGVVAGSRTRKFGRGEVVFHEGDPGDSIQVIVRGHFALRVTTTAGDVCLFRVYGPGDTFGRVAVAPIDAVREMTVVSLEEGETFELFRPQLDELRAAHPRVNDAIIAMMGRELYRGSVRLLEALYVDADRRVRRRLLELGEMYRDGDAESVVIPMTQADIAALAGASRATVNRVLGYEAQHGAIERRRGKIMLLDATAIADRAR
ncbi:MAG: Crp/Fnr family transcriptional regulator [Dehalococcoidia bacterium]